MVTGASRGIGLGAARALGESGARVILVARSAEALARAAEELKSAHIEAEYSACDLEDSEGIAPWFDECVRQFGQPDILVNAAGIQRRGLATELPLSDWNQVLAVNATAIFELSRCFARGLIAAGRKGKIVNIASVMTAAARRGVSAYTASKGAVGATDQSAGDRLGGTWHPGERGCAGLCGYGAE